MFLVMQMSTRVVVMMSAACGFAGQLAVEIGIGQFFNNCAGLPGADGNALLPKEVQRATPNATGNDDIGALLA